MAELDYFSFESGNPISQSYCGQLFQTLELFGYFEHYQVRADGTIWLVPTKLVPSGRKQEDVDAPELIKVDLPPVQIIIDYGFTAVSDVDEIDLEFKHGVLIRIECKTQSLAYAA